MPRSAPAALRPRAAFGLPLDLGDGLTLRWARRSDAEEIVRFDTAVHGDEVSPKEPLALAFRRLLDGGHPTTGPRDFTVVRDANAGDRIVSSLCSSPTRRSCGSSSASARWPISRASGSTAARRTTRPRSSSTSSSRAAARTWPA